MLNCFRNYFHKELNIFLVREKMYKLAFKYKLGTSGFSLYLNIFVPYTLNAY